MSKSTISTFQLFEMFPTHEAAMKQGGFEFPQPLSERYQPRPGGIDC
jgi:hypothetical protein